MAAPPSGQSAQAFGITYEGVQILASGYVVSFRSPWGEEILEGQVPPTYPIQSVCEYAGPSPLALGG